MKFHKFEGVDFKYNNSFSKLQPKDTQMRQFWSQTYNFFALYKTLRFAKFKGTDFKYENDNFSNSTLKHPNKTVLVPDLKFLFFARKCFYRR